MEKEIVFNINNSCFDFPGMIIAEQGCDEYSLFNNQQENHNEEDCNALDFCETCINNFQKCDICEGYFDNHFYYNDHESKCMQVFQMYREKEDLIECLNCKSLVKIDQFESHKVTCEAQIQDTQILCSYCNVKFSISLIEDHEKACKIIFEATLISVDTIDCEFCKEKVPLKFILSHEGKCQKLKERQVQISNQIKLMKVEYPKEWEEEIVKSAVIDENISLVSLNNQGSQYKFVQELFNKTVPGVPIINIFRIQNRHLWEKYSKERARIINEKGSADEKWLFHGTRSNNPKCVYQLGFDISFASDQGAYGRGVYFARQSIYSYSGYSYVYEGKGYMFLAKVITGKTFSHDMVNRLQGLNNIRGNIKNSLSGQAFGQGMKKPPFLDENKFIYYDSVSNASNPNDEHISQMYIVYENDKAYPYYLIEFDSNNQSIPVNRGLIGNIVPVVRQSAKSKKSNVVNNPFVNNFNNVAQPDTMNNNLFNNLNLNPPSIFGSNSNLNQNKSNIFNVQNVPHSVLNPNNNSIK
jgi:hypothetical protein